MIIGCCSINFYLHGNQSLNGKRQVVRSIKNRQKNSFNYRSRKLGDQDNWQYILIEISAVGSDRPYMDGLLTKVADVLLTE
jgi:uncharacterized protein YlxP (DUF503 family)